MKQPEISTFQKNILDHVPVGILQVDTSLCITYANAFAESYLELDRTEMIGKIFYDLPIIQVDEDMKELKPGDHAIDMALKGETIHNQVQGIEVNGKARWISAGASPVFDEEGKVVGAVSNFSDITDKINLELKHKVDLDKYKRLINEAPYAITIYNSKGLLVTANPKCEELWRIPIGDYVGEFNIFESEIFKYDKALERINKAFKGEAGEVTTTITLPHADNLERDYRIKYYPLYDVNDILENVVFITEDITDYREAEEKTKKEELLKQGILDALGDAILVIGNDGRVLNINKSLENYLKEYPVDGLEVGASIYKFINHLKEGEYLREGLDSILKQTAHFFDHELKLNDGRWYNIRITPLVDRYGAVISWQNVNTRREIELALERSLKKYRNIYNKAPVMMHSINREFEIISVSDFWLDKMGYERNEVIGKPPMAFMTEDSKVAIESNLKTLLKEGEVWNAAYRFVKKSGEVMDVLLSAIAEYDENGQFERSITGMIDVTQQKIAERELQESQFRLLEAQKISKIGNYDLDVATGDFTPSIEMINMFGLGDGDRNLDIIDRVIHPEDLKEFKERLYHTFETGKDIHIIFRINHLKTGKIKWIAGRGRIIKDANGQSAKMIGTVQDITDQKISEQKIARLSNRALLAAEIASLGVWEYDIRSGELFWEEQMYRIFADQKEPLKVRELKKVILEDDWKILENQIAKLKKGVSFLEAEYRIKVFDEVKYVRSFTRLIRDEDGKEISIIGVIYDISKDKIFQQKLEASLDEKNVLIKEVHHRVKNNMQLISSIMALKSYDLKDEESKAIFEEVNNRIKAMSVIHDKLYTFYNVSEIDVREYLQHIAQELQVLLGTNTIVIEVESETIIMNVDKALLIGLIVSELVSNAIKHSLDEIEGGIIKIHFSGKKDCHCLRVVNNGQVIPQDVLSNNTGLGVSLIKTFAKQLRGEVTVDPENGFRIDF
ncbi:MAG: hypothetical protein Tsb0034_07730 [Ekhidna sp.]